MLNRRHLRIKVLQFLYAYYQSEQDDYANMQKQLINSVDRIYDLYLYFLLTFSEVKSIAEERIETNKSKIRPSDEELNPNLKFVNNKIIQLLEDHKEHRRVSELSKVNWVGDENKEMFKKMYLQFRDGETYFEFMNNDSASFEDDKNFAIAFFKEDIANFELLYSHFEERSIHWLDDIDLACTMVVKTLKTFTEEGPNRILELYKDEEDEQFFVKELLKKTISLNKESEELIDELTSNWELDRIAKMDVILMKMAIAEIQVFNNIPTKVTLNEYIEISKYYSTPKSNKFINGVLDKAIVRLEKDGKIQKVGRGLKS